MSQEIPGVYIISDSIGETAELAVKAAASQFDSGNVEIRRIPNVSSPAILDEAVAKARRDNFVIVYTLVLPELLAHMHQIAPASGVVCIDILAPLMDIFTARTGRQPKGEPGLLRKIDKMYFRRVEAVEFAVRYDDGNDPRGIRKADIVLIGISRTSKTPLSMYLAHKRLKVANVPLVPEIPPPEELFQVDRSKIIGLVIQTEQLNHIRNERLKNMGVSSSANYASPERIFEEMEYALGIMKKLACPIIDVTNKAVEETASKILEIYYGRVNHVQ